MSNRIIRSGALFQRSSLIAFLLSLLFTGLGQLYNGELAKGMTFFIMRILSLLLIPFFLVVDERRSYVFIFAILAVFHIFIWLIAAVEALFSAHRKRSFTLKAYNSVFAYCAYGFVSSLLLSIAVIHASLFFVIVRVNSNSMNPTIAHGEYVLINKYMGEGSGLGDAIIYDDEGENRFGRIIAEQNGTFIYKNGLFEVNRVNLSIGVFSDRELDRMGLENREDIFFENNDNRRYPIKYLLPAKSNLKKKYSQMRIGKDELLVAIDNRREKEVYRIIGKKSIIGRVEGIIIGNSMKRMVLLPFVQR
jgi:signal peptidase I